MSHDSFAPGIRTRWSFILVLLLGLVPGAPGTTYYVSSASGRDTNSGLSVKLAWNTIARVNQAKLGAGDFVLFKRGEVWRETLTPSASGSTGKPITFGAFGRGPKPVISGSDLVSKERWVRGDQGRWYVGNLKSCPIALWESERLMLRVDRKEQLSSGSVWWCDQEDERAYLLASAPPARVEVQAREVNIDNHEQSHIVYDSLDLRHARQALRLYSWSVRVRDITLENSSISTGSPAPYGNMSAGVYASVHSGSLEEIIIQHNSFVPYPSGLEHWGVYFVQGVNGFRIVNNTLAPAGEDAITVWHSENGVISGNSGGGNGENTVDVKDSHDIVISENRGDRDGEYNIVVHGVDAGSATYNIIVEKNRCTHGGQAGELTAGIVLLFTRNSVVRNNVVEEARGAGIFLNDRGLGSGNEVSFNLLRNNGTHQRTGAITLEDVFDAHIHHNTVDLQGSGGFAVLLEGGPHTGKINVSSNALFPGNGKMVNVSARAEPAFIADQNIYFSAGNERFVWCTEQYSFSEWQAKTYQDSHSWIEDPSQFRTELSRFEPEPTHH
jgi:Periplasmic copper-binding protein (NosD)